MRPSARIQSAPHVATPAGAGIDARLGPAADPPRVSSGLVGPYFAAATAYLVAGAVGLVWIAPDLAHGMYLSPHVASVTHLFTLGWLTLTIFGALGQILPMALGTRLQSARLGRVGFWLLVPGIGVFAAGVAFGATPLLAGGVMLLATGILGTVLNFIASLAHGRTRDVTCAAIAIGLIFLIAALLFGLVLTHNLHSGFVAAARVRILAAHLHVAVVGWVLIVVVGVSRRLLPTFLAARATDRRWSRPALVGLALGVPALATGLVATLPALTWVGAALLLAGMAAFLWQSYAFYRARARRQLDVGMQFVFTGLPILGAAAAVGPVVLALGGAHSRLATSYVVTALLGGLVPLVTGFLYEIVPALAWGDRYAGRLEPRPCAERRRPVFGAPRHSAADAERRRCRIVARWHRRQLAARGACGNPAVHDRHVFLLVSGRAHSLGHTAGVAVVTLATMTPVYAITPDGEYVEFPNDAPLITVDVRKDLRAGRNPFAKIMAAVDALPQGHVLRVRAILAPVPLISLLSEQGFVYHMAEDGPEDWSVWFWRGGRSAG